MYAVTAVFAQLPEDIRLVSRILCVADVFEAITAQRVYRPAMSIHRSPGRDGRRTMFDLEVLDAFYAYLKKRDPIIARLIDQLAEGAAETPGNGVFLLAKPGKL